MEIRCRKGDCSYNTSCSCHAPQVAVGREGDCETYDPDPFKESLVIANGNLFEISDELITKSLRDVPLSCTASNCLYNRSKKCFAHGISIIDDKDDAECATFIER